MDSYYISVLKEKLEKTDWSVLPDVENTLVNKDEFVQYRKSLRLMLTQKQYCPYLPTEPVAIWSAPTPVSVEGV
jgi:hypothetical protein